mgnify:CR=1 FL=1
MSTFVGMFDHRHTEASPLGRRIRLSTREIAISVALTVAALAGIAVFSFGQVSDETAMTKPMAADLQQPQ